MSLYTNDKIGLIPWDARSEEHANRLHRQRIACGWRAEEVPEWQTKQLEGAKFFYWVVLADAVPNRDSLLGAHCAEHPQEATPLRDTASAIWLTPRTPSNETFLPIGHLALEAAVEDDLEMGLRKDGVVWIKHLYISWPMQAGGFGKAAMQAVEALAALKPLCGKTIVLDTPQKEVQSSDEWKKFTFTDVGRPIPDPYKTTQEWYGRMGYEVFYHDHVGYPWVDTDGTQKTIPRVMMKKAIA
ncbi:hypothetical protein ACHAQA_005353 [Verticillium albo-atrum]